MRIPSILFFLLTLTNKYGLQEDRICLPRPKNPAETDGGALGTQFGFLLNMNRSNSSLLKREALSCHSENLSLIVLNNVLPYKVES